MSNDETQSQQILINSCTVEEFDLTKRAIHGDLPDQSVSWPDVMADIRDGQTSLANRIRERHQFEWTRDLTEKLGDEIVSLLTTEAFKPYEELCPAELILDLLMAFSGDEQTSLGALGPFKHIDNKTTLKWLISGLRAYLKDMQPGFIVNNCTAAYFESAKRSIHTRYPESETLSERYARLERQRSDPQTESDNGTRRLKKPSFADLIATRNAPLVWTPALTDQLGKKIVRLLRRKWSSDRTLCPASLLSEVLAAFAGKFEAGERTELLRELSEFSYRDDASTVKWLMGVVENYLKGEYRRKKEASKNHISIDDVGSSNGESSYANAVPTNLTQQPTDDSDLIGRSKDPERLATELLKKYPVSTRTGGTYPNEFLFWFGYGETEFADAQQYYRNLSARNKKKEYLDELSAQFGIPSARFPITGLEQLPMIRQFVRMYLDEHYRCSIIPDLFFDDQNEYTRITTIKDAAFERIVSEIKRQLGIRDQPTGRRLK